MTKKLTATLLLSVCALSALSSCGHSRSRSSGSSPYLSSNSGSRFGLPVMTEPAAHSAY